jgi:hypothetical protein
MFPTLRGHAWRPELKRPPLSPGTEPLGRRDLLRLALSGAALAGAGDLLAGRTARAQTGDDWRGLKTGVASYTLRKLPLDACIRPSGGSDCATERRVRVSGGARPRGAPDLAQNASMIRTILW